jgi:hypothetical protein
MIDLLTSAISGPPLPKSKNVKKYSQEFVRARAQIAAEGSIHRGLARYKLRANLDELRRVLPIFLEHPAYRSLIWPRPAPRSYNLLGAGGLPVLAGFQRELVWSVHALVPHATIISEFIRIKADFEESFLRGDEEKVRIILTDVERRFGVSLWLAEATINTLQTFRGYSAQQEFSDSIAITNGAHPLVRYVVSWLSSRASQNIAPSNFYNLLDDMVPLENGFATLRALINSVA